MRRPSICRKKQAWRGRREPVCRYGPRFALCHRMRFRESRMPFEGRGCILPAAGRGAGIKKRKGREKNIPLAGRSFSRRTGSLQIDLAVLLFVLLDDLHHRKGKALGAFGGHAEDDLLLDFDKGAVLVAILMADAGGDQEFSRLERRLKGIGIERRQVLGRRHDDAGTRLGIFLLRVAFLRGCRLTVGLLVGHVFLLMHYGEKGRVAMLLTLSIDTEAKRHRWKSIIFFR